MATLLSGSLNAQTYPDYVLGSSNLYTYSSIVRCYSPTEAVSVSYHYQTPPNSSYSTIHVVGLSTNEYSIDLEPGYCVFDMEIANGYLVMCGRYNYSKGFIASVYIPDIISNNASVVYHVSPEIDQLSKMVAYVDQAGDIRVYAMGEVVFSSYPPTFIGQCVAYYPCSGPYLCSFNVILELVNPQIAVLPPTYRDYKIVNYGTGENIDDIVLTDNYVVFVGQGGNGGNSLLTIHPCDKNNVLPNLNNHYHFPIVDEGYTAFVGCHMEKDTIAIASRGRNLMPNFSEHDTRIRVIDAASMVMTSSQAFDLNDYKTDPRDMVYSVNKRRLVLLEDIVYPPSVGSNNFTFLFLEPYNAFPGGPAYMADGFFEAYRGLTFWSLDRVGGETIVATGGDYWMLKSVPGITPVQTCYKPVTVRIHQIDNIIGRPSYYPYIPCYEDIPSTTPPNPTTTTTMIPAPCYVP